MLFYNNFSVGNKQKENKNKKETKMAKSLYTLMEGEKVLFELKASLIVKEGTLGAGLVSGFLSKLEKIPILSCAISFYRHFCFNVTTPGAFVVTDQRIISSYVTQTRFICFTKEVEKVFESHPANALNGFCGYTRDGDGKKHCCSTSDFVFTVGLNEGNTTTSYAITTDSVETDEQAQALVATISSMA